MIFKCRQQLLVFLLVFALVTLGAPVSSRAEEIPRKILGLYDSQFHADIFYSPIHLIAEMPLNHLGLEVIHRSVTDPYPSETEMKGVRGILTWFERPNAAPDPTTYCQWLKNQMLKGIKVVILEQPGIFSTEKKEIPPACQEAFHTLGLEYLDDSTLNPYYLEVVYKDPSMVEFERKLEFTEQLSYRHLKVLSQKKNVYLQMRRTDLNDSESDLIFTTPQGGYVHESFVIYQNMEIDKIHWRLNPFRFFEDAFDVGELPHPDTTTMNGRRIFYTHIDGDGIFNLSHIRRDALAGEIIQKEIVNKYQDVPLTISIISGYLETPQYQDPHTMSLYQNLFGPPNVEPASHGYAHPLIWKEGTVALKIPGYQFSETKEIKTSVDLINQLLQNQNIPKKTNLFLWTGDCLPEDQALAVVYQNNLLNINGGNSQFDKKYDSYTFVFPIGLLRGQTRQIYTSAPNENVYTNLWEGPYYGFNQVIDTFKNTEEPIRIKPINIYYHFYSGEHYASLKALIEAYDYALSQDIFPVFTSDYVKIANDFFSTKIEKLNGGFRITNQGYLKTIRYDHENRYVDMRRSKGTLGFDHFQGNLYVFLDESDLHDIYLTPSKPNRPYVTNANATIFQFSGNQEKINFIKQGWLKSEVILEGLKPSQKYRVRYANTDNSLKTDLLGRLMLIFDEPEKPNLPVKVAINHEPI